MTIGNSDGWLKTKGKELVSYSPIDGKPIAKVIQATREDYEVVVKEAQSAFKKWCIVPAPKRGQIVREIGDILRQYKEPLGELITLERVHASTDEYNQLGQGIPARSGNQVRD